MPRTCGKGKAAPMLACLVTQNPTGGAAIVTLQVPASAVKFFRRFVPKQKQFAPRHILGFLAVYLASLVLATSRRRSLTAIGGEVYAHRRDKSTIGRMLKCRQFRSRDLHWATLERVLAEVAPTLGDRVDWHVALDGTANPRGASTKILGAILPRMRPEKVAKLSLSGKKKGRRTKYHTFLLGVLTTHEGVRIPLPRYTCDPRNFNRRGRPRKVRDTQLDLAKLMLVRLIEMLPPGVRLVVTADSYFESEKLTHLARTRGFLFIAPIDSNRCFADEDTPNRSNGERIRDHGLALPWGSFSRLDLARGSEETACYRRYSERKPGPKDRRTYWLHHERRTVAKLGTVGIVSSWKTPVYEPRRNFRKKSFKILVCSDPNLSGAKVVEWYECRWTAIEILIRELKQQLGFGDYTGQSLEALERHVDLVLMSLLYLETHRATLLKDDTLPSQLRRKVSAARTLDMQRIVRAETERHTFGLLQKALRSQRPSQLVMDFLAKITHAPQLHWENP